MGLSSGFWVMLEPPIGIQSGALSGFVGSIALAVALGVRVTLGHGSSQPSVRVVNWLKLLAFVFLLAAIPMFLIYVTDRSSLVFEYKAGGEMQQLVRGTEYHPGVKAVKKDRGMTDTELLNASGGAEARNSLWTDSSLQAAEWRLSVGYVLSLLFTLLSTIFFIEILRVWRDSGSRRRTG